MRVSGDTRLTAATEESVKAFASIAQVEARGKNLSNNTRPRARDSLTHSRTHLLDSALPLGLSHVELVGEEI